MIGPADLVWPKLEELLSCLESKLSEYQAEACRTFIAPGSTPAWDVCCECEQDAEGMAWVQLNSVFPTDDFPDIQTDAMRCPPSGYGAEVAVSILRCASVMDDHGRPPSSDRLTAEARKLARDRSIMLEAVRCCYLQDADPGSYVIGSWVPLGPDGGCVGGQFSLTIAVDACRCPPDDDYDGVS